MKKAVFVLGLLYLAWTGWTFFTFRNVLRVYQDFGIEAPQTTMLYPVLLLVISGVLVGSTFVRSLKRPVYVGLFIAGVVFVGAWILILQNGAFTANQQIDSIRRSTTY